MQNFGKIKNYFNTLMVEAIATKDNEKRELFKEYVRAIKNDEILKAQFLVYDNIENKIEENEHRATEFVKANIDVLKKYTKEQIAEANVKLATPILVEQELPESENELAQLHEDITTLIFTESNADNVDEIVESLVGIVDYIKENEIVEENDNVGLPTSVLANIAVDKFNERYSELNEDEKDVLKRIIESDDEGKKEIFESLSRECIDLVDQNLVESDIETKEKLLQVKDRILRLEYDSNSFVTDVSRLIELKGDLSE